MIISLQGRLLQWSKWSWRGLCPLICVHVSQWAERRVDAGLKNILRRPDWTRLQRYFNGRLTWFPTKKNKWNSNLYKENIPNFVIVSKVYNAFHEKKKSTNWIHLKAHNICFKMQASTITYMSSSTMTLIFSQPSGGSRPNEYDLFGRGLATTLKWESGVSDSHPSISG